MFSSPEGGHVSNFPALAGNGGRNWYQSIFADWLAGWLDDSLENRLKFKQETGRPRPRPFSLPDTLMPLGKKKGGMEEAAKDEFQLRHKGHRPR